MTAPSLPKPPAFSSTPLAPQIKQLEDETSSLRKRLEAQRTETRTAQKNNELLRNELALLRTQVGRTETTAVARAEVQSLRAEHLTALAALKSDHQKSLTRLTQEHGAALNEAKRLAEKELSELREQLKRAESSSKVDESTRVKDLNRDIEALQRQNTALEQKVTALEQKVSGLQQKLRELPPTSDDLTRIKGIGPTFATALKAAGITTFAQIAAWTEQDIERLAPLLRTTTARIQKHDWPNAARKLS